MDIIKLLEYIGVFAFAFSGAVVGVRKRMDIFGIFIMAAATATGGGIIRDVIMNLRTPKIFSNYISIAIILVVSVLVLFIRNYDKLGWVFVAADALGLGVFVADTGAKAIDAGYIFTEFLFLAMITGVGGGVIRDLLAQRVPVVLRKEVYAMAGIIGAIFLWFSYNYIGKDLSVYITVIIIFAVRMISLYKQINLPVAVVYSKKYRITNSDKL